MTTLVTGATGKTGRTVVELLVERGEAVRAASRHPVTGAAAEGVRFDWSDRATWPGALAGVDRAYLVATAPAAQVGAFVEQARAAGVERVVLLSALGVDRAPDGTPMKELERAVTGTAASWTVLRPNWFHQNFGESYLLPPVLERDELPAPTGDAAVSFIDARDIGAVAVAALLDDGHDGRGYPLTGPAALTFGEVAEAIAAVAGRPVRHVDVTPEQMHGVITGAGVPAEAASMLVGLYELIRTGMLAPVTDDVARITGRPAIPLEQYLADNAAVWAR